MYKNVFRNKGTSHFFSFEYNVLDQCPDTLKELQNTMMQFADMERDLSEFRTALGKMKDEVSLACNFLLFNDVRL